VGHGNPVFDAVTARTTSHNTTDSTLGVREHNSDNCGTWKLSFRRSYSTHNTAQHNRQYAWSTRTQQRHLWNMETQFSMQLQHTQHRTTQQKICLEYENTTATPVGHGNPVFDAVTAHTTPHNTTDSTLGVREHSSDPSLAKIR
jgi:hypothetical protein